MFTPVATIALQVVHEALRARLPWLLAAIVGAALGAAAFIGAITLTETVQVQAALLGALLRLAAVFLVAAWTVTSIAREQADKGQELLMALPIPRAVYYFGKLAGLALVALAPALLFGALALLATAPESALIWTASLLCELWIVAAFALLAALGMQGSLAALSATLAFYLLARALGGLQLLAAERGGSTMLDLVGAVLPRLDLFTRADWLVYGDATLAHLSPVLQQTALYLPLLAALALFDLYRKDL